jgi:hypothetical protein
MEMTVKNINKSFKKLGLITDSGKPISLTGFRNRSNIHTYGKGANKKKILFVGHPKENMWGFYFETLPDPDYSKKAFEVMKDLIKGNLQWLETGLYGKPFVQWGNCGIPIVYGNLRKSATS